MSLARKESFEWIDLVQEICKIVGSLTGNVLAEKQFPMVESRIKRRCSELKLQTPQEYYDYWKANKESENQHLISLLTTHFTSFFREFLQFEWLATELPSLVQAAKAEGRSSIKIWSAACSKGQEVWSLCMWMQHHMPKIDPKMQWSIVGSDIDPESVKEADNAVYHRRELETAPRHLWEGLWTRGTGEISDWYKVKNDLKGHAKFQVMNLLKLTMPKTEKFDVVLCRNVLIYFDRSNQQHIAQSLLEYLTPHGALITGTSESLSGLGLPIKNVAASIYRPQSAQEPVAVAKTAPQTTETTLTVPTPLKIFCIDDSPTVITILKKSLAHKDFEIIGTAANGKEAIEKLKTLKPDVITLDLHMPEMDGPTFLKTSGAAKEYPVIVVSSVGRDHVQVTAPLFEMGVTDFVEKPTLTNMNEIAEELKQKLKMGWLSKKKNLVKTTGHRLHVVARPNGHIVMNFKSSDQYLHVVSQQEWKGDELTFIFQGTATELLTVKDKIRQKTGKATKVNFLLESDHFPTSKLPTIWLHFDGGSLMPIRLHRRQQDFLVVEETSKMVTDLKNVADDVSPATSFSYLVDKLLAGE